MTAGAANDILGHFGWAQPVILDGAWGTELQARGLAIGECPDAWNLVRPDAVSSVARAYVDAGSQVILTNTFGASRIALQQHGLAHHAVEINRIGARISIEAAGTRAMVFGSIGPTGAVFSDDGLQQDVALAAFQEQAEALTVERVSGLVIETMCDLTEARLALRAATATGLPVVACMTYSFGKAQDRTITGITPEQAAAALQEGGAWAIGANCGNGAEQMLPICRRLRAATSLPLWIKPNAGLPTLRNGVADYATTPEQFAAWAEELVDAGASFIGGCCGTSPDFIGALVEALSEGGEP